MRFSENVTSQHQERKHDVGVSDIGLYQRESKSTAKAFFQIPNVDKYLKKRELAMKWLQNIGTGHTVDKRFRKAQNRLRRPLRALVFSTRATKTGCSVRVRHEKENIGRRCVSNHF